jgi:signal transduction protein with GAF and PtsI domain
MADQERIDIDIFKIITKAIAGSDNIVIMAENLTQLLVGALEIKGCTLFALNPEVKELEVLASFGMSVDYMSKGPILCGSSIAVTLKGKPVVIKDVTQTDQLQYPDNAKREGIGAIVSVPINFSQRVIGVLRLYHYEAWDISDRDLESLMLLAENVGLAMMYTELRNALGTIRDTVNGIYII